MTWILDRMNGCAVVQPQIFGDNHGTFGSDTGSGGHRPGLQPETGIHGDFDFYPLPRALRTFSGVAGDSTHLPIALWIAIMTRCVFAREWLMPLAP